MKINIQAIHFIANPYLINLIHKKINSLLKFYFPIQYVEVYLKLDNSSSKSDKLVEVKVVIPNKNIVITKHSNKFKSAIILAITSLKRQLLKQKSKLSSK